LLSTQNTVPCCSKYIPTDCFFGDFAHWVSANSQISGLSLV